MNMKVALLSIFLALPLAAQQAQPAGVSQNKTLISPQPVSPCSLLHMPLPDSMTPAELRLEALHAQACVVQLESALQQERLQSTQQQLDGQVKQAQAIIDAEKAKKQEIPAPKAGSN